MMKVLLYPLLLESKGNTSSAIRTLSVDQQNPKYEMSNSKISNDEYQQKSIYIYHSYRHR